MKKIVTDKKIKTAIIGLGGRGLGLLKGIMLHMPDLDIVAACDAYKDRAEAGAKAIRQKQHNDPVVTTDYKVVLDIKGLECIVIATAWEDHMRIAIEAMKKGIYVGMEVGGAYCLDDCWELVKTYEKTGVPCMLLENCCYGEYELMVKNMCDLGLFGEVVHCSGGYCHDLRSEIAGGKENRHYRLRNYIAFNRENYPTHELGPIAKILKINETNLMTSLVSVASKARGLHQYIADKKSGNKELMDTVFKQGDVVNTIITCKNGETISITLDTTLPRYYSRGFTVRGTKAMYQEDGNIMFVDGRHNIFDMMPSKLWNNAKRYAKKYRHPIWTAFKKGGVKGGHGGMDWLVLREFFDAVARHDGIVPIDVYDTASWMSISCLSEQSIANGGAPVSIPNFTINKK